MPSKDGGRTAKEIADQWLDWLEQRKEPDYIFSAFSIKARLFIDDSYKTDEWQRVSAALQLLKRRGFVRNIGGTSWRYTGKRRESA